jgi:hypothetical protein
MLSALTCPWVFDNKKLTSLPFFVQTLRSGGEYEGCLETENVNGQVFDAPRANASVNTGEVLAQDGVSQVQKPSSRKRYAIKEVRALPGPPKKKIPLVLSHAERSDMKVSNQNKMRPGGRTAMMTDPFPKVAEICTVRTQNGARGSAKRKAEAEAEVQFKGGMKKCGRTKRRAPTPPPKQAVGKEDEGMSAANTLASLASIADLLEQEGDKVIGKSHGGNQRFPVVGDKYCPSEVPGSDKTLLCEVDVLARLQIYAQQMGYFLQSTTVLPLKSGVWPVSR